MCPITRQEGAGVARETLFRVERDCEAEESVPPDPIQTALAALPPEYRREIHRAVSCFVSASFDCYPTACSEVLLDALESIEEK